MDAVSILPPLDVLSKITSTDKVASYLRRDFPKKRALLEDVPGNLFDKPVAALLEDLQHKRLKIRPRRRRRKRRRRRRLRRRAKKRAAAAKAAAAAAAAAAAPEAGPAAADGPPAASPSPASASVPSSPAAASLKPKPPSGPATARSRARPARRRGVKLRSRSSSPRAKRRAARKLTKTGKKAVGDSSGPRSLVEVLAAGAPAPTPRAAGMSLQLRRFQHMFATEKAWTSATVLKAAATAKSAATPSAAAASTLSSMATASAGKAGGASGGASSRGHMLAALASKVGVGGSSRSSGRGGGGAHAGSGGGGGGSGSGSGGGGSGGGGGASAAGTAAALATFHGGAAGDAPPELEELQRLQEARRTLNLNALLQAQLQVYRGNQWEMNKLKQRIRRYRRLHRRVARDIVESNIRSISSWSPKRRSAAMRARVEERAVRARLAREAREELEAERRARMEVIMATAAAEHRKKVVWGEDQRRAWKQLVVLALVHYYLDESLLQGAHDALHSEEYEAAAVLQRAWRAFYARQREEKLRRCLALLRPHGWRFRHFIVQCRRWRAVSVLRSFLLTQFRLRFNGPRLTGALAAKVRTMQRAWLDYRACTRGRMRLLGRVWDAHMRPRLEEVAKRDDLWSVTIQRALVAPGDARDIYARRRHHARRMPRGRVKEALEAGLEGLLTRQPVPDGIKWPMLRQLLRDLRAEYRVRREEARVRIVEERRHIPAGRISTDRVRELVADPTAEVKPLLLPTDMELSQLSRLLPPFLMLTALEPARMDDAVQRGVEAMYGNTDGGELLAWDPAAPSAILDVEKAAKEVERTALRKKAPLARVRVMTPAEEEAESAKSAAVARAAAAVKK